jgi:hypothetical protein
MDHGIPVQVFAEWKGSNQGLYPRFIESKRGFWNGGAPFRGQYVYTLAVQVSVTCERLENGTLLWTVQ